MEWLLNFGADVDAQEEEGYTPLHFAVAGGHTRVLAMLLAAGADVNAPDATARTPLHLAADEGLTEMVEVLCEVKC